MKQAAHIVFCITLLMLFGCKTTEFNYRYDFTKKKLEKKESDKDDTHYKASERPVQFPANSDLQVTIQQYNPLRDEVIVEDSSSQASVGDTTALARLIVFPSVQNLAEGEKKAQQIVAAGGANPTDAFGLPSANYIQKQVPALLAAITDCELLMGLMKSFNIQKDKIAVATRQYKELMGIMEIVGDDAEFLKTADVLVSTDVQNRLSNSLIARLNAFLPVGSRVNPDPALTSSRQLASVEAEWYQKIKDEVAVLDQVKSDADELKGQCASFIDLYKKFNAAYTKTRDQVKELETAHTDKLIPAFNKKLLLYDQLKRYIVSVPMYVTKAVNIDKDFHSLHIYRKQSGQADKQLYDHINVVPTRGFKLRAAGGIFFSGLTDLNYAKKTKDSIITKPYLVNGASRDTTLVQTYTALYGKGQEAISYGGMLYLQAQSQNGTMLNYGGYVGFGALFNDQARWAGAVGLSAIIGRKQHFSIHAGLVMAQMEKLTEPYKTDTWYTETIDNIPTYKGWKISGMLGFSWAF